MKCEDYNSVENKDYGRYPLACPSPNSKCFTCYTYNKTSLRRCQLAKLVKYVGVVPQTWGQNLSSLIITYQKKKKKNFTLKLIWMSEFHGS